ncbi:MAG: HAMP domain-containing histidine kinase, partial [Bacteroidia bacterium]|nr:HAMP domain-containing histidine kinase [Bacteroidia bacterium]
YSQKQTWKLWLFTAAIIIVGLSLWYTNTLVNKIADDERKKVKLWADAIQKKVNLVKYTNELFDKIKVEERKKVELWAEATRQLSQDLSDYGFVLKVVSDNTTVPVILVDSHGNPITSRNLDPAKENDKTYLKLQMQAMRALKDPIEISIYKGQKNYLYYKDSKLFSELKIVLDDLIKSFISEVAVNSASVPVIYTDSTKVNIIAYGNIDSAKISDTNFVKSTLAIMEAQNTPIEVQFSEEGKNYIFYQESTLLTQLKYYPFIMFGIIGVFLLVAYLLFSTARRVEQNQVWVGMAKETAHQLGTPLSSLMAWLEYLKSKGLDTETAVEIEKDVKRLETITERFSKIGSVPKLDTIDVVQVMQDAVNYMKLRTSKNVSFSIDSGADKQIFAQLNVPLFEWVVENLIRNAVDAMNGNGEIKVLISDQTQFVYIDIADTGKGIPKSKYKTVFEPGYTTKQRGWGLGLSLTKRIIENYHSGKIFVKGSEIDKGTTFRIVLNKI